MLGMGYEGPQMHMGAEKKHGTENPFRTCLAIHNNPLSLVKTRWDRLFKKKSDVL